MSRLFHTALAAALILGTGSASPCFAQAAPKAVPATLVFGKEDKEVDLVGRDKDLVLYRPRGGPEGASTSAKLQDIASVEFVVELDRDAVAKAWMAENWPAAAVLLLPAATPLLPYLDMRDNNGVELAMQAGQALVKSARNLVRTGGAANLERATNVYVRARDMLTAVGAAEWSPDAERARLNAIQCRIAVGDLVEAGKDLEAARVPEAGDDSFGLYWLTRAQWRYAKGQIRSAMDAVVKSLVFEDKDIETFPDALLLSGRCYEDLLEWHRARDVYYEVARLFPGTGHAEVAREKLKYMMDKGLTKEKEVSAVEVVFFGLDEDVNAKVKALLNGDLDKAAEAATDLSVEEDAEEQPAARKPVEDDTGEGAPEQATAPKPPPRPSAPPPQSAPKPAHKADPTKAGGKT
jgi:tetratricopeptide (TPR) repeat protein